MLDTHCQPCLFKVRWKARNSSLGPLTVCWMRQSIGRRSNELRCINLAHAGFVGRP